jgi:outer membrane lipopolysaccharide assembly protein LptE/RlpB
MIIIKKVLSIFCLVLVVACGYQMVGKETHVPPGLSSIAIPTFKNKTFEPGIEIPFTQAFLNEFILDRRVKVTDRAEADSILEGAVISFTAYAATFDASGFVSEYVMTVTINLSVKDRAGKVLRGWNSMSQTEWFQGSSVGPTNEAAKQVAIQKAAAALADSIRSALFSNF